MICGACLVVVEKWRECVKYHEYVTDSKEIIQSPKNTQWIDKHGCTIPPQITVTIRVTRCQTCGGTKRVRASTSDLVTVINDSTLQLAGKFVVKNESNKVIMDPWIKMVHDPVTSAEGAMTETETETETEEEEDEEGSGDESTVLRGVGEIKI